MASLWSGSPDLLTSIVTRAAPLPPGRPCTESTLPTFTPAIRTGDFGWRLFTFWNTAENVYGCENGFVRVKASKLTSPITTSAISAGLEGRHAGVAWVLVPPSQDPPHGTSLRFGTPV